MYLNKSEIVGSEKPVIFEKSTNQFTYDELINLNEDPVLYEHVGFQTVYLSGQQLFEKLYQKGE